MNLRLKQSSIGVAFTAALIFSAQLLADTNQEEQHGTELILQIQSLQEELATLRNQVEQQGYQIKQLQKSEETLVTKMPEDSTSAVSQWPVVASTLSEPKKEIVIADPNEIGSATLESTLKATDNLATNVRGDIVAEKPMSNALSSIDNIDTQSITPSVVVDFPLSPAATDVLPSNEISSAAVTTNLVTKELTASVPSVNKQAEILEKGDRSIKTDLNELDIYNKGIEKLNAEEYKAASSIFSSQIQNFPKGQKTADAYYWLAESFYILGDYESATKSYQALGDLFPAHSRTPKALMKAVGSQQESGDIESAKITLLMLLKNYPSSDAAIAAKKKYSSLL